MTDASQARQQPRKSIWRQIADEIQHDIQKDVLKPGDRLPTEQQLTARFGVNRHTVRRAIAALSDQGVVRAEQGRGTFVQSGRINYQITRRTRFSASMLAQERESGGMLLAGDERAADQKTATALKIEAGSPIAVIELLRLTDGYPAAIGTHIFAESRFPNILAEFARTSSITSALEALGISDYIRGRTQVTARMPGIEEARLLQVPRTKPLLVTEAINLDLNGDPIEFGIACFPADRVQLVFEP